MMAPKGQEQCKIERQQIKNEYTNGNDSLKQTYSSQQAEQNTQKQLTSWLYRSGWLCQNKHTVISM